MDWERLYDGNAPVAATRLPAYPFARKRYWRGPGDGNRDVPAEEKADSPPASPPEIPGVVGEDDRPAADSPAVDSPVMERIRGVIDRMLELDDDEEIDERTNFSEMGFSSVTIVAFIETLNKTFDLSMPETTPFDHPDMRELGAHVASRLKEKQETEAIIQKPGDAADPETEPPLAPDLESTLLDFANDEISAEKVLETIGL